MIAFISIPPKLQTYLNAGFIHLLVPLVSSRLDLNIWIGNVHHEEHQEEEDLRLWAAGGPHKSELRHHGVMPLYHCLGKKQRWKTAKTGLAVPQVHHQRESSKPHKYKAFSAPHPGQKTVEIWELHI